MRLFIIGWLLFLFFALLSALPSRRPQSARKRVGNSVRPVFSPERDSEATMLDIIYIAVALGFFALCAVYVRGCDRL